MHPILFYVGDYAIHTYGVAVAAGLFLANWVAVKIGEKEGISNSYLWDIALLILIGGVAASRLEYVRTHWADYAAEPARILALRDGGLVFYGGFLGASLAVAAYARYRKLPLLKVLDIYAHTVPFGHALGRIGCFAAGCCFGHPTDLPWAVTFPEGSVAPAGIALHPTQLYEASGNVLLGFFLLALRKNQKFDGLIIASLLMSYALFRALLIEPLRGDDTLRGVAFWGLSNAQATALGMFVVGAVLLGVGRTVGRRPATSM